MVNFLILSGLMELKYLHVNNRLDFQGLNFWLTENNRQLTSARTHISVIISLKLH